MSLTQQLETEALWEQREKAHREKAAECHQRAGESFERSDTDGFLSQWASGITARLHEVQAEIARNGGKAQFVALFNLSGERIRARVIRSRYGLCWMLLNDKDEATGEFAPYRPRNPLTLAKKGYREDLEWAPAAACLDTPKGARGLGGAASVYVKVYRTDGR
jgi:hypothetical protein